MKLSRLSEFQTQTLRFLEMLFEQLRVHSISLADHWMIDHLCYRVSTEQEYFAKKDDFSSFGELLIESEVNGRLISTFKLFEPIKFRNWNIPLLELPAPKKGKHTPAGWEHIEVVCDVPFSSLRSTLAHCCLDLGGLAKPFNQEFEIKLRDCAVKFHHLSLESVIRLERNEKIHGSLMRSKVLNALASYNPLIAGTFPLGLEDAGSDLDILVETHNFDAFSTEISSKLGSFTDFKSYKMKIQGIETLVANFSFEGVPYEVFAQPIPAVAQKAYRHFHAEERLLHLGGRSLQESVLKRKIGGLKTEPAFAEVLRLNGDPYESLLEFQQLSEQEIIKRLPIR